MSRGSFARGLVFASLGGLGAMPFAIVAAGVLGYANAMALYALALVPLYLLVIAPTLRRGAAGALLAAAFAMTVLLAFPHAAIAGALTPFLLGIPRSAMLFPRPWARAVWLEFAFSTTAFVVAFCFSDGALVGDSLAIWTFWLVQAGFAVAPGEARKPDGEAADPFEVAQGAITAVLERRR